MENSKKTNVPIRIRTYIYFFPGQVDVFSVRRDRKEFIVDGVLDEETYEMVKMWQDNSAVLDADSHLEWLM